LSLIPLKNKKDEDIRPYSTNPVFLTPIAAKCPYSVSRGRKKQYHTLWHLYLHVTFNHPNEPHNKIFQDYAKKIIRGEKI